MLPQQATTPVFSHYGVVDSAVEAYQVAESTTP